MSTQLKTAKSLNDNGRTEIIQQNSRSATPPKCYDILVLALFFRRVCTCSPATFKFICCTRKRTCTTRCITSVVL